MKTKTLYLMTFSARVNCGSRVEFKRMVQDRKLWGYIKVWPVECVVYVKRTLLLHVTVSVSDIVTSGMSSNSHDRLKRHYIFSYFIL